MNPEAIHAMVDIETFSTKDDAAIMWIGACKFTVPDEHIRKEKFLEKISFQSNLRAGRAFDQRTLNWWAQTDSKMFLDLLSTPDTSGHELRNVLNLFRQFLLPHDYIWSNGMNFDLKILGNAYLAMKQNIPWKYKAERDTRTLWHVAGGRDQPEIGVRHNPLDDAVGQAVAVVRAWNKITKE